MTADIFPNYRKAFSYVSSPKGAVCTVVLTEKGRWLYFSVEVHGGSLRSPVRTLPATLLASEGKGRKTIVFSVMTLRLPKFRFFFLMIGSKLCF
jgi:hypothetical protein